MLPPLKVTTRTQAFHHFAVFASLSFSVSCVTMPERIPKPRRASARSAGRRRIRPPSSIPIPYRRYPSPKQRKTVSLLRRYSSDPVLLTVQLLSDDDGFLAAAGSSTIGDALFFPCHQTCTDAFTPLSTPLRSLSPRNSAEGEEVKVVVSVTVEGSPGPVRAMLRLGASVEEAIAAVVDRYVLDGRSPHLDRQAAGSFQLHHSHFCLQSLNKCDKIGDVGGRSFYLKKTSDNSKINIGGEETDMANRQGEIELIRRRPPEIVPPHLFFSFMVRRFNKIGRRTRKLWKVMTCIICLQ